jgi:hypothetical protein
MKKILCLSLLSLIAIPAMEAKSAKKPEAPKASKERTAELKKMFYEFKKGYQNKDVQGKMDAINKVLDNPEDFVTCYSKVLKYKLRKIKKQLLNNLEPQKFETYMGLLNKFMNKSQRPWIKKRIPLMAARLFYNIHNVYLYYKDNPEAKNIADTAMKIEKIIKDKAPAAAKESIEAYGKTTSLGIVTSIRTKIVETVEPTTAPVQKK